MVKQFYNKGNKCFMLIDTDKKGGIVKASKKPFNEYPIENIGDYMEKDEEERPEFTLTPDKKGEKENGFYGDEKDVDPDPGKDENVSISRGSEWDDVFS